MADIDYKELLVKYIDHVGDVEGSTFLYEIKGPRTEVRFTDAEVQALSEAEDMAQGAWAKRLAEKRNI